jgi:hypothetical protein
LFAEADSVSFAALEDAALVAKLSVLAALAFKLWLEEWFKLAANVAAALVPLVVVLELLLVPLLAEAPLAAVVVLLAVPTFDEVLPPLEPLLLNVELPIEEELPPVAAVALFAVVPELDVLLFVFALFAEAFNDAAVDLTLLAVSAAFSARALVVELDLLALLAAEADSVAEAVLLALACCMLLLLVAKVFEELLVVEKSLVFDLLLLAEWFSEALMLDEEVSVLVSFELLLTVNSLFAPLL